MKTNHDLLNGAADACMSRASCDEDVAFAAMLRSAASEIATARLLLKRFVATADDWLPADSDVDDFPELAELHKLHFDVVDFIQAPSSPANTKVTHGRAQP
jgi:hypothetical protein